MQKKRVLLVNEASVLRTGFAVIGRNLLSRWYKNVELDICELGTYAHTKQGNVPWKFVGNMPENEQENSLYNADSTAQFGNFRFHETCLAFKPHFVVSLNDIWTFTYLFDSPYRQFYKLAIQPAIDAAPQDDNWLYYYLQAEGTFYYSDWARKLIENVTHNKIKSVAVTPAGADFHSYFPAQNKAQAKQSVGLAADALVVGTVMRNSKRKLYPDLITGFAKLYNSVSDNLRKRLYLYIHAAILDVGWNLAKLIKEAGISRRVILTYLCRACGTAFPCFYSDARVVCTHCKSPVAFTPNAQDHYVSEQTLGEVYRLFDLYVQLASAGSQEIPVVEAAACGVPVMCLDYAGMEDYKNTLGAISVKVKNFIRESETHRLMASTDIDDLVEKMRDFLSKPESLRLQAGIVAREGVERHYNWDVIAKRWEDYFVDTTVYNNQDTWYSQPRLHQPNLNVPEGLSNEDFVRWGILNIIGRPFLLNSYTAIRLVRNLNWGASLEHYGGLAFNELSSIGIRPKYSNFERKEAVEEMLKINNYYNKYEHLRLSCKQSV